jgi:radical SAM-linked protein
MAYSAGFTPHPKISYANAAATGVASEAEYVEIALTRRCQPDALRQALDTSLPSGLDVLDVVEAAAGSSLADALEASVYEIRLDLVPPQAAIVAVERFLQAGTAPVERLTKNGVRQVDARPAVLAMVVSQVPSGRVEAAEAADQPPCAILRVVVRHTTPAVRPDDVLEALRQVADLAPPVPPQVTRLAQGPLAAAADDVTDPLATDRA